MILNPDSLAIVELTSQVEALQLELYSLQEVVTKTEIAEGFFSDIIGFQLTAFAVIVGLVGFLSWVGIKNSFNKNVEEIKKHFEKKIQDLADLQDKIDLTQADLSNTISEIYQEKERMYFDRNDANNFLYYGLLGAAHYAWYREIYKDKGMSKGFHLKKIKDKLALINKRLMDKNMKPEFDKKTFMRIVKPLRRIGDFDAQNYFTRIQTFIDFK